jgi:hypothetical protein
MAAGGPQRRQSAVAQGFSALEIVAAQRRIATS